MDSLGLCLVGSVVEKLCIEKDSLNEELKKNYV